MEHILPSPRGAHKCIPVHGHLESSFLIVRVLNRKLGVEFLQAHGFNGIAAQPEVGWEKAHGEVGSK